MFRPGDQEYLRQSLDMAQSRLEVRGNIRVYANTGWRASGGLVHHHTADGVRQIQFPREAGLGHGRHPDQIAAITLHAIDLRRRLQSWSLRDPISATGLQVNTGTTRRAEQQIAQPGTERCGEVNVPEGERGVTAIAVLPPPAVVDQLIGHYRAPQAKRADMPPTVLMPSRWSTPSSRNAQTFAR